MIPPQLSNFASIGLLIVLLGFGTYHYGVVNNLENSLDKEEKEHNRCIKDSTNFETALNNQSESIQALAIDYEDRINTYEHLINTQEPELRYKYIKEVIYKDVNSSVKDRSCEESKQIQINTYNSDWNKF